VKSAWNLDIGCGNTLEKVKLKLKKVKKDLRTMQRIFNMKL